MRQASGRRRKAQETTPPVNYRPRIAAYLVVASMTVASMTAGYLMLGHPDRTEPTAAVGSGGPVKTPTQTTSKPKWDGRVRVLGDGSTSNTGPQPDRLTPVPLKPGEKPPQFVVFSWDGALAGDDNLFEHYRDMSTKYNAHMTYFLTGIYLLPKSKADLYSPPQHPRGSAAISYATDDHIRTTLEELGKAWREGNEIGTHFNGHFCGKKGGGDWSVKEWKSEIDQFFSFVQKWKTNTGYTDLPPLPFDAKEEVTGGRAPCLEGQKNLLKAAKSYGWRYDASSAGDFQIWPKKKDGIWDFPLQMLPYDGGDYQGLSMDFNFLYNQSNGETNGPPAEYPKWQQETVDAYMAGFGRVYYGSRAPLFIGNHFEQWNGGIYMKAVDEVMARMCSKKDVECVSFKELADWLDVQSPATLERLRGLDPAQSPDWSTVVK
ncbi:hypothetical protein [Streptomyces graminilatus]|uniref:hypothetical protein n=1 Tax=Streptomyces graminilatus TaxID=1464070 RepID=UPI0006E31DCC|nr:hypothetical protein [Streptomyces graminilatus]